MERDELTALRANLLALEVPEVGRKGAFYLSSSAALCLSAADYIQTERLSETNFVSAQDLAHAKSINSLWSWEVRAPEQALRQNRAASSLPVLLGHLGDPLQQHNACQAFSSLFPDMTLCFNDFLEAGWVSIPTFVSDIGGVALFEDQEDLDRATAAGTLWTLVDQYHSKTVHAASTLPRLLALAFDRHPTIVLQRALLDQLESRGSSGPSRKF